MCAHGGIVEISLLARLLSVQHRLFLQQFFEEVDFVESVMFDLGQLLVNDVLRQFGELCVFAGVGVQIVWIETDLLAQSDCLVSEFASVVEDLCSVLVLLIHDAMILVWMRL